MLELVAGDYRLVLSPERGGSILDFLWCGEPLMRPTMGETILDVACFPLVPFSNRIAHGRFDWEGKAVRLAPNLSGNSHPLHGFGWLAQWEVVAANAARALLRHDWPGGEWPWRYRSELDYQLTAEGLTIALSLTNLDSTAMPAGLGFHPYFARNDHTRYLGLHRGEWQNDADCLPLSLDEAAASRDWWNGQPVGNRLVDTVYTKREGALWIEWPERGIRLTIDCSTNLPFTCVFTPQAENWFCVEPVSHMTNAVNQTAQSTGLVNLAPGETLHCQMALSARRLP